MPLLMIVFLYWAGLVVAFVYGAIHRAIPIKPGDARFGAIVQLTCVFWPGWLIYAVWVKLLKGILVDLKGPR
jgi:hypothetical protein